jgi:xanthine/uracil permease
MSWATRVSIALRIASIVGLMSLIMFGVTTFLFHFSGGQVRMEPVVRCGAYAAFAAAMLLATVAWRLWLRSPTAALIGATISAIAVWAVALFIEWRVSFVLGAG